MTNPGFYIFGLHIAWYGVIIASSMLIAIIVALNNVKYRGQKRDDIITLAFYVLPLSIIGARLYYVAFFTHNYTFLEIFQIYNGGMAIYGGIIGGAIGGLVYCLIHKKNYIKFADIVAPGLILAQSIGRWGNFVNQEAFGSLVTNPKWQWFPFSVFIESEAAWHLATFFYESLWNLIGFIILMVIIKKCNKTGIVSASYLLYYGIGRLWIEGLRTDSLYFLNFRVSQIVSVLMILGAIVWMSFIFIKRKKVKKV